MARLVRGRSGSSLSSVQARLTAPVSCEARLFGSKLGVETIASTAPVSGSRATTEPRRPSSASQAAS